jgi:glycosyltransferase involved in cell wall biosynthesis
MSFGLVERGWTVSISTLRQSATHSSLTEIQTKLPKVQIFANDTPHDPQLVAARGNLLRDYAYHKLITTLFRTANKQANDVVLLPYLDYCLYSISLLGSPFESTPWAAITLRPAFHYRSMGMQSQRQQLSWLRARLFRRLLSRDHLKACFTIDEPLAAYCRARRNATRCPVDYLPDPIAPFRAVDATTARHALDIPKDATVILVFGRISSRKGISQLIDAVASTTLLQNVRILIVGEQDETARVSTQSTTATLLRRRGQLLENDCWVSRETEAKAFSASDIVWLGYIGHWQSSGVLIQAGMAELPVAACEDGIIGWHTRRHDCGITFPMNDRERIAAALTTLATNNALRRRMGRNGLQAASSHTTENAVTILDSKLRSI